MCPLQAARIFKNFKDSSWIYSRLPTKQHKGGGLSTIEVPLPMEGETLHYHIITNPLLIEKEILRRNKHHFRQAGNTQLAGKDVIDKVEFGATTKTADDILEGTADIDAITNDSTSKCLFETFKTSKPELEIEINKDKMMDRYKTWNERTVTSTSGRHLGHSHALFRPFKYDLEDPGDIADLEEKREIIIDVHFLML